jgi:GH24 family phage-related lysozyme (muramidase)
LAICMAIPALALAIIKEYEGIRLSAYPDPDTGGMPYTIGWGSTQRADLSPWKLGDKITAGEADQLLIHQLQTQYLPGVRRIPGWEAMTEGQQSALLSFAYNLGANFYGAKGFDTITRLLKTGNYDPRLVEGTFRLYRNPGSAVEAGLLRRRIAEAALFNQPYPAVVSAASAEESINLVDAALYYRGLPHQKTAIQWLQGSTGIQKQAEFARLYRDSEQDRPISFVEAFQYWAGLPHQRQAFEWLQANTEPKTLVEFARLWRKKPSKDAEIRLQIPYFSQRDNYAEWWRTCFSSTNAMAVKYFNWDAIASDDEYLKRVRVIGDTTSQAVQSQVLAGYGIKHQYSQGFDFEDLDRSLDQGLPVAIGILHRGSWENPTGGHWLLVIGRTASGDAYWCHDPFGDLMSGYSKTWGEYVLYPRWALNYRWLEETKNNGWGTTYYGN